jgi:hypothetical protein
LTHRVVPEREALISSLLVSHPIGSRLIICCSSFHNWSLFNLFTSCELYNARPSVRVESIGNRTAPTVFLRTLPVVDARLDWENAYPLNRSSVIRHAPEGSGVYGLQNVTHWVYIGHCPNIRGALLKYLSGQMPYVLQSESNVFVFELCLPRKRMERQQSNRHDVAIPVCGMTNRDRAPGLILREQPSRPTTVRPESEIPSAGLECP